MNEMKKTANISAPQAPGNQACDPASPQERADRVWQGLVTRYPTTSCMLDSTTPWQLLVATVLSAQCTDARVNLVTPALFARWPGPEQLCQAQLEDLEACIRSTGFYHNKAKNLLASAHRIMEHFHGELPTSLEELITLPGVARKTANVVLWNAFGKNEGLAVDTHVKRLSMRLGLTEHVDPVHVEKDLMRLFPQQIWGDVNHRMVWFGRDVCVARTPRCQDCEFSSFCPRNS